MKGTINPRSRPEVKSFRAEAAMRFMAALVLSNRCPRFVNPFETGEQAYARQSVQYADTLIAALERGNKKGRS